MIVRERSVPAMPPLRPPASITLCPHIRHPFPPAGDGIEYAWGKSKYEFRRLNDGVPANLRANIKKSFEVLTRERCFVFSRKARSYKKAYRQLAEGNGHVMADGAAPLAEIERLAKLCKTHRCALDLERRFILAS